MYIGAIAWSDFQVSKSSLNWILWRIGNQWSCFKIGEIWSNLRVRVNMRAAAFWARWSFVSSCSFIPYNREFPLSNLDVTKAWSKVAAVSSAKTLRIWLMFLIWKYVDLQTLLIWSSKDSVLSKIIPKLLETRLLFSSRFDLVTWTYYGRQTKWYHWDKAISSFKYTNWTGWYRIRWIIFVKELKNSNLILMFLHCIIM